MFVLAVQIHQTASQGRKRRNRGGTAVGPGPIAALRIDVAPDYEPVLLDVDTGLGRQMGNVRQGFQVEARLDNGAFRAGPDQLAAGTLSHEQGEGVDQHRLPRTGLSSENVQPRPQWEGHILDYCEITNAEFVQHLSLFPVLEVTPL